MVNLTYKIMEESMFKKSFVFLISFFFLVSIGLSQDIEFNMDQVRKLVETNGKMYLQPLVTGYGSAMNTGLYHTAKTHKMLGFDVGIKIGIAIVPSDNEEKTTYDFDVSALENIPLTIEGYSISLEPTKIFSDTKTPNILGGNASSFTVDEDYVKNEMRSQLFNQIKEQSPQLPDDQINAQLDAMSGKMDIAVDGIDVHSIPGIKSIEDLKDLKTLLFPFPILQASVGLPFGLEPSIRLIPAFKVSGEVGDALGEIGAFGIGLKVDVDQFIPIPLFPIDIATQIYFQKFSIGEILTANNVNFNIHASKKLLLLTPYIGLGMDKTNFTASYKMQDGTKQEFKIEGENGFRATFGLTIKLLIPQINIEYNIGEYNSLGISLGIALR